MAIRIATEQDLGQMLTIYAPYVTDTTVSFEYEVPTPAEFAERFRAITAQFPWLVWEETGSVLGYAYASAPFLRAAYRWCAEPSIYLAQAAQRRGIGRQLYAALEQILQKQGYRLLYAIITAENQGSLRFHESVGYRHLADFPGCGLKHGKTLGVTWMEKQLEFVGYPSNFPLPWKQVVDNDKNSL